MSSNPHSGRYVRRITTAVAAGAALIAGAATAQGQRWGHVIRTRGIKIE